MDKDIALINEKVDQMVMQIAYLTEQAESQQRRVREFDELKADLIPIGNQLIHLTINELEEIGTDFELEDLLFLLKRIDSAAAVYAGMLRWGRRSGLPAVLSETPVEYGERLKQSFPRLKMEIEMIIEAFNREIYGQIPPDMRTLTGILSARRRMRNPRHWPLRLRAWFAAPSKVLFYCS